MAGGGAKALPSPCGRYEFLAGFLGEMAALFPDPWLFLGGDEVGFDPACTWPGERVCGYHCFDKDEQVAAWMDIFGPGRGCSITTASTRTKLTHLAICLFIL